MARGREIPFDLPSLDELFTTQSERDEGDAEKVQSIPLDAIDPFPHHPFQVRDDEEMAAMAQSVRDYGVISPVLLRPAAQGRYELVSGHRRKRAAETAGLAELPAVVRQMTRDEAVVAMVDSNMQRERVLPSEKAFAYKMKLEAMRRQGARVDLTCSPVGNKLDSAEGKATSSPMGTKSSGLKTLDLIGRDSGDSRNTVHRYIRLTELIKPLLDMVDAGDIGMRPAVELSYLATEEQGWVAAAIESEVCTPSHVQAAKMRTFSNEGRLNEDVVLSIMREEKPNQVRKLHISAEKLSKFFRPGTSREEMEARIIKGLELLQRQERRRDMGR